MIEKSKAALDTSIFNFVYNELIDWAIADIRCTIERPWIIDNKFIESLFFRYRPLYNAIKVMRIIIQADTIGNDIPIELIDNESWNKFNRCWELENAMINDILSFKKDIRTSDLNMNFLYLKMVDQNMTPEEVINYCFELMEDWHKETIVQGNILKKLLNPKLNNYVDQMLAYKAGNIYWHSLADRYDQDI